MTYWAVALVLIALGTWAAVAGARRIAAGPARRRHLLAVGVAALVLMVLTAIFDNLMIAAGLMEYDLSTASGRVLWLAPIEDFSYPLACALAVPGLWLVVTTRKGGADA